MVYFSGSADQAGTFFKQARLAGYNGTLMNIDDSPALVDTAGPLSLEGGGLYYTAINPTANAYPEAVKFTEDFLVKFGAAPQPFAAVGYDAAGVCLKAIAEASKAIGGEIPTRNQVANAIRTIKDYKGITGTYNLNNKGDLTLAEYSVYKVATADPNQWGQNILIETFELPPPE
jgi:branched-chain amino acid transport system substrate-binding protein